jgi:hypothetical protein
MTNKIIETEKTKLKLLGYYQIIGAVLGFLIILYTILTAQEISISLLLIILPVVCLYIFSAFCGHQLLFGSINLGLKLSTINQLLQAIHFSLFGLTYKYVSGLILAIGLDYTTDPDLLFNFALTTFDLTFTSNSDSIIVGVNLIAVYAIYLIDKLKQNIDTSDQPSI